MVTTDGPEWARRMRAFRNHGITTDHRQREAAGSWYYEMVELGFNYRLTDLQCALGLAQLPRLPAWLRRREEIARRYHRAFAGGVRGTRKRRAARPKSDSAETSSPGAKAPPRKSPSALTTSKFVVVPKSTTIAGPP